MPDNQAAFESFARALIGLPVSHIWRGYGSTLFLEFGELRQHRLPDGAVGRPVGQMGLMIQWSWRIEGARTILCGSWSEEAKWPKFFEMLMLANVTGVVLFSRLLEIDIALSNRLHVVSFSTTEGQPQWALFHRETGSSVSSRNGALVIEATETPGHPPVLH